MRKSWLVYGMTLGITCVWASTYGGALIYALLYTQLLLPVVAWINLQYVYHHLSFEEEALPTYLQKKTPFFYEAGLKNTNHLFCTNVAVRFIKSPLDGEPMKWQHAYLLPGHEESIQRLLVGQCRGSYELGVDYIEIYDFLLLFCRRYRMKSRPKLMVLPRRISVKNLRGFSDFEDKRGIRSAEETYLESEVHSYQNGEPLKAIHWKASAKKGELLSRPYAPATEASLYLLVDLAPIKGDTSQQAEIEDCMLEVTIACLNVLVQKGLSCQLCMTHLKENDLFVRTLQEVQSFYEQCGALKFEASNPLAYYLQERLDAMKQRGKWLMVIHEVTPSLMQVLGRMVQRGDILLIYIISNDELDEVIKKCCNIGIEAYQIKTEGQLKEWLEQ